MPATASIDIDDMTTTKSFILTIRQVQWIRNQSAQLRQETGSGNESVVLRRLLDRAMASTADTKETEVA